MEDWLRIGTPAILVRLNRNARARRLLLRVPGTGGAPVLTVPARLPAAEALHFAARHEAWLRARLSERPAPCLLGPGAELPVAGEMVRLGIGGRRARLDRSAGSLLLPGPEARLPAQAGAYLREAARAACVAAAGRHAAALGREHGRISLRDPRSRWGSCTSRGDLMLSWRLAMAPPAVLDYVVAHEVAHLVEMNHSARFWRVVDGLCPGYAAPRAWLRRHGAGLHRYDFRAVAAGAACGEAA